MFEHKIEREGSIQNVIGIYVHVQALRAFHPFLKTLKCKESNNRAR